MKNESLKFLDKVKRYDEKCGSALADKVCGRSNQKENNIINISKKERIYRREKMKRKAYDGIYNQYIKRGIDFCLALVGLIIAAIPMAIVAVAIKAESKKRSCDL